MYGPHIPYMEQVSYGPPHVHVVSHMWSVLISYMTLMVPHTLYRIGIIWSPHMYVWSPHMCYMTLMFPHTWYGTGIAWSPHMWSIFMSYMTLLVLHTLYGLVIIWSSTCTFGPPTCTIWCQWLLWSPSLIWNRYLMVSFTLYGTGIIWSPHMYVWSPM